MTATEENKAAQRPTPAMNAETASGVQLALVGVGEIHQDLVAKISIQRVRDLTLRSDFPKPAAELAEGDVWILEEVQAWLVEHKAAVAGLLSTAHGPTAAESCSPASPCSHASTGIPAT